MVSLTLALGLLVSCGERNRLPAGQDARTDDGFIPADGGGPRRDGCARPLNGCFSDQDCSKGHECVGCGADPCCPMCAVCYGVCKAKAPGPCTSSADCLEGSYCHFASGCGKSGGTCKARPKNCYWLYKPVCGCDGKTYSNECVAWSQGVSIAHPGACIDKCKALNKSYAPLVTKAKVCCPMCNTPQCLIKVKSHLACGCDTYINAGSAAQQLAQIANEWDTLGCTKTWGLCPPGGLCPPVTGATCTPDAVGSGTCKDSTTP
jgi:hypothetical protein